MIACDVIRGVLVLVMAIPGMPLAAMVALLFVVTLAEAPFSSARAAIFPDVLTGDRYVMGTAVALTTYQFAQVIGFAVGGTRGWVLRHAEHPWSSTRRPSPPQRSSSASGSARGPRRRAAAAA